MFSSFHEATNSIFLIVAYDLLLKQNYCLDRYIWITETIGPCSSGWPGTLYVDQADFELKDLPNYASEFKAWVPMPSLLLLF